MTKPIVAWLRALRPAMSLKRLFSCRFKTACGTFSAFLLALSSQLHGASGTWSNVDGGTWSTATNWGSSVVADGAGFTAYFNNINIIDTAKTIVLDSSRTLGSIRIGDNNTTSRQSYIINPSTTETLTLDNGSANSQIIQWGASNGDTIAVPLLLNSSLDIFNMTNDRNLTISGAISSNTTGVKTITVVGLSPISASSTPSSTNLTTSGVILSGVIGNGNGQVRLVVDSHTGSSLTLSGANTFTGGVTLNAGTLILNSTTALGTTGALTINGGYLNSTAGSRITMASGTPVILNNDFSFLGGQTLDIGNGSTVTMNRNISIATIAGQLSIYGSLNDGGQGYKLTKTGFGTLYLQGTQNYTGGTVVDVGALVVNSVPALGGTGRNVLLKNGASLAMVSTPLNQAFLDRVDVASVGTVALWSGTNSSNNLDFSALPNIRLGVATSGTGTYSGILTPYGSVFKLGGGGGTLTVTSELSGTGRSLEVGLRGVSVGNVTLSGGNTFDGNVTIFGPAILQLNGNTGRLADTSGILFAGNGTFRYDNTGASGAISETVGSLQFLSGEGTVLLARTQDLASTLTVASLSRAAGATGNINITGTNAALNLNKVVIAATPATGFLNPGLYAAGANYAAYDASGYIRALNYSSDPDTAAVTGSLTAGIDKHVNVTGTVSSQATASVLTLRISSNYNIDLASGATLTVSNGGILKAGNNAATLSGGTGITTGGATELIVRADQSSDVLNINTSILSSSTGGLTKSGAGVVVLGVANGYSGTTTLNAGTLRALNAQAFGTSSLVLNAGTLDLRVNSTQPGRNNGSPETFVFGNDVSVLGDSTITIHNIDAGSLYQNKIIQLGALSLGGNTLNVTVNAGYGLEFSGTTTLSPGSTGNSVLNIGTARTSNLVPGLLLSGKVTGTSNLSLRGAGTLQLTNASNDFIGDIRIAAGVLAVSSDGALGNAANQVRLIDSSTGSTFRATDTFASSRLFTLGNGTATNNIIQVVGGKTFTLNSAFLGNNGFTKLDNGTFEINAANASWDGDVLIQDGVLKISNSAALGTTLGNTQVNNLESALHLNGGTTGLTLAENFILFNSGINNTGALYSLSGAGTNTLSGTITLTGATTIGVAAGGTLRLTSTSPLTGNTDVIANGQLASNFALTLTGDGTGYLAAPIVTGSSSLTKLGAGSWTLTGTSTFTGAPIVNQGTLILTGAEGKVATSSTPWQISAGSTLVLDNTNGHLDNRLGLRGIHFGGNLTIIGDATANTLETISSSNLVSGNTASILTLDADATRALTFQVNSGSFTRSGQGTSLYRGDNLGSAPGAGVATMLASTAPTFVGQTGAAGTTNRGILPWAIVDTTTTGLGAAFATYSSTNGIMALNAVAGEQLGYVSATANVATTGARTSIGAMSINSLNLGTGGSVKILPLQTLTLESGGLLAFTGNSGIQGGILQTASNRDVIVHALGDINISAVIANTSGGLTKTGAGTLTLGAQNFFTGGTSVNQGTLVLAGGKNTLIPSQTMTVNSGGTLDLNGTVQTVGILRSLGSSGNETPIYGGIVTSSSAATLMTSTGTSSNFTGQITGNISLGISLAQGSSWVLTSNNTYSGITLIAGGIVNLRNDGRLSDTSAISLQYGTLRLDNNILADNADRVADDANITMSGGSLNLLGRAGAMSYETVGNVTLSQGMNVISSAVGTNNGNFLPQASVLTLTSLTRNAAAGATVNFGQTYSGTSSGTLGLYVNSSGAEQKIIVTGGLPTVNNIIGAWAIYTSYFNTNAVEFIGYDTAGGVGPLNTTGFAGYDASALPGSSQPTQNIRINTDATVAAGGLTLNTLNILGTSAVPNRVITFTNNTDVLNLTAGGLIFSIGEDVTTINGSIGATQNNGRLTAGGTNPTAPADLFIYHQNKANTNTLTLNAAVIDNPTNNQSVRLIVNGTVFGQYPIILASNLNSYTGGTIINGQTLQVGNVSSTANLPAGGITINGGTLTQVNGTIAAQDLTMNGPAVVNLTGTNTFNAIAINNTGGGTTTPTIAIATGGTLNMAGNITATSMNPTSTATISGGTLSLNGATRTIDASPITFNGESISPDQATLSISSVISGSGFGLVKTGTGLVQLGGTNTFSTGVDVQQGGLIIANNSALGTGTLTLGNNTIITADGTARAVTNAVTINGDFTMGVRGVTAPAALTLSGAIAWGSSTRQVTVNSNPATVQTISGQITGSGALVKEGIGTLLLSGTNTSTLNWTEAGDIQVNNGTLRINADAALGAAPTNATAGNIVLNGGALSSSATLTLNANRGIAVGSSTGSGTGNIDVAASTTLTYNGVITDNGTGADGLVKTSTGTLILGGANTYSGVTTVANGTLQLSASGSIDNSSRITVNTGTTFNVTAVTSGYTLKSGQTLEGSGTVNGNTTALSGATIAPGTSENRVADKLTFTGSVTLNSGSTLKLDINAPTFTSTNNFGGNLPGTAGYNSYVTTNGTGQGSNDLLSLTGGLTQATGAQIQVIGTGLVPVAGQIYNLLDWGTLFTTSSNLGDTYRTGANDSSFDLDLPDISASGYMWDISNFATAGILVVVVPEPSRALLLLLALTALGIRRRRHGL